MSTNRNINDLPLDILSSISSFLTHPKDIAALAIANKKTHEANQYKLVWKKRCETEFPEAVVAQANQSDIDWRLIYRKETLKAKFSKLEDLTKPDKDGKLPIVVAHLKNNQEWLDHFYQLAIQEEPSDLHLHWAIVCRQPLETINPLIASAKNVDVENARGISRFLGDGKNFCPIVLAVRYRQLEVLKKIIEETKFRNGRSIALVEAIQLGYLDSIDCIVSSFTNTAESCSVNMSYAIDSNNIEVVKLFIKKGANLTYNPFVKRELPLQRALRNKQFHIAKLLLENGASFHLQGNDVNTALIIASEANEIEVVKLLLEKGADVNQRGIIYTTALMAAAEAGNLEIVKLLVERGADINASNYYQQTALHFAAHHGHLEVVRYLVSQKPAVILPYVELAFNREHYHIVYELNKPYAFEKGLRFLNPYHLGIYFDNYPEESERVMRARINFMRNINYQPKELILYNLSLLSKSNSRNQSINYFRHLNMEAPYTRQFNLWKENICFLKDYLQHEITQVQNGWSLFKSRELHKKFEKLKALDEIDKATNYDQLVEFACQQLGNKEAMSGWTSRVHKMCKMIVAGEPAENFAREIAPVHEISSLAAMRR